MESKQQTIVQIEVEESHELVRMTKIIDWVFLVNIAVNLRSVQKKSNSGPKPHYRELLGAVILMSVKKVTFREAEDLVAHYAPARYLCGLLDSDWKIDHVTIFEFTKMLGANGMDQINQYLLESSIAYGLLDPAILMSDTTAQEARIPYPNEVGLMGSYYNKILNLTSKLGGKFIKVKEIVKSKVEEVKGLVRSSHLFAKKIADKRKVGKKLLKVVSDLHQMIKEKIDSGRRLSSKAGRELTKLNDTMDTLIDQIWYFVETGQVASKKIIHLGVKELYSIVRGKAGKRVEFGLKWGINRLGGGYLQGFLIDGGKHCSDKRFCLESISVHEESFGEVPEFFGFDRGGYSGRNIKRVKRMGVANVGIAPSGKESWEVSGDIKDAIIRERAQVEAGIGTIKSPVYGFNKPHAHSLESMKSYGHRAILGFNLRKLIRDMIKIDHPMAQ